VAQKSGPSLGEEDNWGPLSLPGQIGVGSAYITPFNCHLFPILSVAYFASARESIGRAKLVKHFQDDPNPPAFIKALAEVRRLAPREGWCYQHVQAIIVSVDQYAEAALGNREYFLNKPQSIGSSRNDNVP
jgi:hypothetical protein